MFKFASISVAMTDAPAQLRSIIKTKGSAKGGLPPQAIIVIAILCAVLPFDISQLVFMVLGACCYWVVQSASAPVDKKAKKVEDVPNVPVKRIPSGSSKVAVRPPWRNEQRKPTSARPAVSALSKIAEKREMRSVTSMPIQAPVFTSTGWEPEVAELLEQIMPTPESDNVVQQLAGQVKQSLRRVFPEADVIGFASGDFRRGKAFGVAVPEVDIVINLEREVLADRLQCRLDHTGPARSPASMDELKVRKSAIRMITDCLVSKGGFKFRRSAFRGLEPKVTVLAPVLPGIADEAVPLDLSVNAVLPLHNKALLTESANLEPRAKELVLLVRRWAKDRGICHAAKGHLPPYQWSLLSIYFLQVGEGEEGPLLPPFECSMQMIDNSSPQAKVAVAKTASDWSTPRQNKTTAQLFKEFIHFYHKEFQWSTEAVSIRVGQRAPPSHRLTSSSEMQGQVGPTIEDPFDVNNNLGSVMNSASLVRLHEELARAQAILEGEASVGKLLELWTPPHDSPQKDEAEDEK